MMKDFRMDRDHNPGKSGLPKRPTINEVAQKAGVSTATVSRVLTGSYQVSEDLVQRVQKAILELGYRPDRTARLLRARRGQKVGLIVPDIQTPFFTSVLRGADRVLQPAGYVLLVGDSDEDPDRERLHIETFRDENVAGIILAPTTNKKARYQSLIDDGIALVTIDRVPENINVDSVTINNWEASRKAAIHLIQLGHTRIGFIGGPENISTAVERQLGYLDALQQAGIQIDRNLIRNTNYRQDGGSQAMENLLSLEQRPTAILAANNLVTLGALETIHERGLSVPEDIALVGFDDVPWAASLRPPLTVIDQHPYHIGKIAAETLMARFKEPDRPVQKVVLDTELIIRISCGVKSKSIQSM
jgi:LacI family transcriptional regulator/LacI family repressor for deo operon, udp, cdd, tsx, nupC, and nupG